MKTLLNVLTSFLLISLTACGGNGNSQDQNLTPLQNEAVTYVKKHLERGDKLKEYQVVEEPMPPAILEQPFLSLRNAVFKAGLDYQSCKTRGLQAGMEQSEQKIEAARQKILETDKMLQQNIGNSNSVIVLAEVKSARRHSDNLQSLVVVFDPTTMEMKEWIPVTVPVQNTVALVTCAKDSILSEYAREQNHASEMLVGKVSDPVLKFVLKANPL